MRLSSDEFLSYLMIRFLAQTTTNFSSHKIANRHTERHCELANSEMSSHLYEHTLAIVGQTFVSNSQWHKSIRNLNKEKWATERPIKCARKERIDSTSLVVICVKFSQWMVVWLFYAFSERIQCHLNINCIWEFQLHSLTEEFHHFPVEIRWLCH